MDCPRLRWVDGNRRGRFELDFAELGRAAAAGATFITDVRADRERSWDIGERQVADYLISLGYHEANPGNWRPRADRPGMVTADLDYPAPNGFRSDRRGFLPE